MAKILEYEYEGKGLTRVFENEKWMVGIKNWKPENDITGLTCLERHNITDELFVLLSGRCTLLYANETEEGLKIEKVEMEPMKVYNIPTGLWHNTVTEPGVKLILIEDSACSGANSDVLDLTPAQLETVRALVG